VVFLLSLLLAAVFAATVLLGIAVSDQLRARMRVTNATSHRRSTTA
jgi:uncharacterized membrane protein YciS (DUF1049 family)